MLVIESREDAEKLFQATQLGRNAINAEAAIHGIMEIHGVRDVRRCVPGNSNMMGWECEVCHNFSTAIPSETVCKGPAEPLETPPDVSHLCHNGLRVEIAEPRQRGAREGELALGTDGKIFKKGIEGYTGIPRWILRTIPWDNVYQMDPALVSLEGKLSPSGKKVRRAQGEWFRKPVNELALDYSGLIRLCDGARQIAYGPDQRRIIVEEIPEPVQEPKVRRWIATECTARPCDDPDRAHPIIDGVLTKAYELADLDDPKVLTVCDKAQDAVLDSRDSEESPHSSRLRSMKAAIQAYLKMSEVGK